MELQNDTNNCLQIILEYDKTVNYAMQQNDVPVIKNLKLINNSEKAFKNIKVKITANPEFSAQWETRISLINSNESYNSGPVNLMLSNSFLAGLVERVSGTISVSVYQSDNLIVTNTNAISILAFDEWNGLQSLPEILASFVMPNHPEIESILSKASDLLGQWTSSTAFSGYRPRDKKRTAFTVAAIYNIIQQARIGYINPPASFENTGQKIRLVDRILEFKLGTCLDLSVLFASCIEQAGLNPLIIIFKGHSFAGFWLDDETFADVATDDILRLRKRVELNQICVFETTLICDEPYVSFERSIIEGKRHLENEEEFRCVIDIARSRKNRIRPLPLKINFENKNDNIPPQKKVNEIPDLNDFSSDENNEKAGTETAKNRLDNWKQKLLDLTLNNRLLNFKQTKKNLEILCPDPGSLEDSLSDGVSFKIYPKIQEFGEKDARNSNIYRQRTGADAANEILLEELKSHRLHTKMAESELSSSLLEIYREAKISVEENGANTLYLALGFLSWYENQASAIKRLSPIILIPLEIERRSIQEGFVIRKSDDEPMVNSTLLAYLLKYHEINITGLDPIPKDEHGIDVIFILKKFREAIINIDRWEIVESSFIGHFSFKKFLMWIDLEVRANELQKNKIVNHLINSPTEAFLKEREFPNPDSLDETYTPHETFCPLSADSSQLAAIYAAAEGNSFVLHGPPGTGKSQTITNIITHNLAIGKTVLFVSEKRAALEVVYRRLSDCGISPFCLELHSNKSNKKEILKQFENALNTQELHLSEEWKMESARLSESRKNLNEFVDALHKIRNSGESVFYGLSQLIKLRDYKPVKLLWRIDKNIDRQLLIKIREILDRLHNVADNTGHPSLNPWQAVCRDNWTPELRNNLESVMQELEKVCKIMESAGSDINLIIGFKDNDWSCRDLSCMNTFCRTLIDSPNIPEELLVSEDWEQTKKEILTFIIRGKKRDDLRGRIYLLFKHEIIQQDIHSLIEQWDINHSKWWLSRWFNTIKTKKTLRKFLLHDANVNTMDIRNILELIKSLKIEEEFFTSILDKAEIMFGHYWNSGNPDWNILEKFIEQTEIFRKLSFQITNADIEKSKYFRLIWSKLLRNDCEQNLNTGHTGNKLIKFCDTYSSFEITLASLITSLNIDVEKAFGIPTEKNYIKKIIESILSWRKNAGLLKMWCHWINIRNEAIKFELQSIVEAYENNEIKINDITNIFDRSYYQWQCDLIISSEKSLSAFFSPDFENQIKRFREIDERYTQLTRKEIYARLAAKTPRAQVDNKNSEMGILRHQLARQKGHLPARSLLQKIPNLLTRLKPCLLMSPISVAQYLDPSHPPFDIVIFDEASQIPVWDAIGAIARGKEVIIVGDPEQLPPTNFFNRVDDIDTFDSDDCVVEDLESILDDCIAARLPEQYLKWHYRSKHESLIAFSNSNYYDNLLLTFPSPDKNSGLKFININGNYDKGKSRTNKIEAEAVVNEVIRRLRNAELSKFSIGIVTFNIAQQILIDDLLEDARRQYPDIDEFFGNNFFEPVFVKNIESVQGDERDVIIFSICYGPDSTGRVSMNFGPINRDGGERRLNVAVTRARQNLIVYSNLRAEHIDLSKTRSRGVADLKCFLDYAERGISALKEKKRVNNDAECKSPFELAVYNELTKLGYTVHLQIGCSGYRIDLGIVDTEFPGKYILGIECDGANYHSAKTARDRDKLRDAILRELGWNLHRIWSTDWWENPDAELEKVKLAIEKARRIKPQTKMLSGANSQKNTLENSVNNVAVEQSEINKNNSLLKQLNTYTPYTANSDDFVNDDFYGDVSEEKICKLIKAVVEFEGPISISLAIRRVAETWGFRKVTDKAIRRIESLINGIDVKIINDKNRKFAWMNTLDPDKYNIFRVPGNTENSKRDIEELPLIEIANAAYFIAEQNVSIPSADLIRETARILGFNRTGLNIENYILLGIEKLIESGKVYKDSNGVIIHKPDAAQTGKV